MKVLTIVGTRPEIIRLSRVIVELQRSVDHVLVHTGQNWDPMLSNVFFDELGLRSPDYWLNVSTESLGSVLAGVITGIERVLLKESPDAVLVLGDTNSSLALIMAKRMAVPTFHMEAGNRCFDENVPEEINRRIVDHTADFNLCYTESARRNLLVEGLPTRQVFVTGSPMAEVLREYERQIDDSLVLSLLGLEAHRYFLVSLHRQENVDDEGRLGILLGAISDLARRTCLPVVVSTHPRLRRRLVQGKVEPLIRFLEPFGYFDYNNLQRNARCVLSDSGTVSEESALTPFPAVTMRDALERPEALDLGSIILTGVDREAINACVDLATRQWDAGWRPSIPDGYRTLDCSIRVVRLIRSLSTVQSGWLGLRQTRTR